MLKNRNPWLTPTSVYCLVAILAFARMVTLSQQQHQPHSSSIRSSSSNNNYKNQQDIARHSVDSSHQNENATSPLESDYNSPQNNHQRHDHHELASPGAALFKRKLQGGGARNSSTRIDTLDDLSHRLDQTPVNAPPEMDDTRVPFWNIAHMINSIEQVDLALRAGSNGIETDISFDANGRPVEAYHGFPCDCGRHCHHREGFLNFVQHLARITVPPASSRLYVVLFDLKLSDLKETRQKETAGSMMAEILHKNLYAEYERTTQVRSRSQLSRHPEMITPPLRVILSINHAHDLPLTRAFLGYMRKHRLEFMRDFIGWDVGMNDPLENITAAWDSLRGETVNIWQGDGLTNCANIVRGVERLKEAITIRNNQGHFRKVYYWTADVLYHIRSVLRLGLDAILTNQPQRAIQVLREPEFRGKYRLATPYDDPFQQFWIKASAWRMSFPSLSEINETVSNIQKTGENFIKTIPDGVAAAIAKVQSSIG